MQSVLDNIFTSSFLFTVIRVTTPILFPALGAVIAGKSGMPNIGLEGIMLMSALAGVIGSAFTASAWLGLLAAVLCGITLSLFLGYFTLQMETNVILGGIALNLFASSLSIFILYLLTGDKGTSASLDSQVLPAISIPVIRDIPFIGEILSGHNVLTYVGVVSVFAMSYLLKKTALGIHIKAVGESEDAAASVGIKVQQIRYTVFAISGALCGFGGAFLSMGYVSWFSRDMTAGRGWIALAAEAVGQGTVMGTLLSSILFGAATALSNVLQMFNMPAELVSILPYVVTVVGLVAYAILSNNKKRKHLQKVR